jgi:hypothetical protein
MRKMLGLFAVVFLFLGIAQGQKRHVWDLSKDLRAANTEISFNQGSNGVWYFMESATLTHDPRIYSFIPEYVAPCIGNPSDKPTEGLACWRDPSHTFDRTPLIGFNFTNQAQFPLYFPLPAHAVYMHPAPDRFAIVAWKSPLRGSVRISGAFSDLNASCGNGVLWSIDKGSRTLAAGDLPNGGAQDFEIPSVSVSEGQVLYFVVDPKAGDYVCDTTMLDLTIREIYDRLSK